MALKTQARQIMEKSYVPGQIRELARLGQAASRSLASSSLEKRNAALEASALALRAAESAILEANARDMETAKTAGLAEAMLSRLQITKPKLERMIRGLRDMAALPDPLGRIESLGTRPNGLILQRMSVSLGLVGMIYEARPEVTVDASGLCLKSGNAVLLRGGKEAFFSNHALLASLQQGLASAGLSPEAISMVQTTDREAIREMARLDGLVDVLVPRGGEALIQFVRENATVPCIFHAKGVCHIFVDESADFAMAEKIAVNAKVSAPAVCNAMETLLVHRGIADTFIPGMAQAFSAQGVLMHGDAKVRALVPEALALSEAELSNEYLRKEVSMVVVDSLAGALDHIAKYGSNHTESIITQDRGNAEKFLREANSSSVMWNASTRFADGAEYGLGAEIGISTQKLPPRGPVGVEGLTSWKFIVRGNGQIRG